MARIRTIKPEFWDSPSVTNTSPWTRLLFIAMWNWADDHGYGTANLKELEGFAFPNDDTFTDRSGNTAHFRDLVAEVTERFGVVFYTVNGRPYYQVPSWDDHQRNERRSQGSKHPGPDEADGPKGVLTSEDTTKERKHRASPPHSSGNTVTGTGEEGKRGRGEEGNSSLPAPTRSKPKHSIPDAWKPTDKHEETAREKNLDLPYEAQAFRNHAESVDRRLVNWNSAFSNWLLKAKPKEAQTKKTIDLNPWRSR